MEPLWAMWTAWLVAALGVGGIAGTLSVRLRRPARWTVAVVLLAVAATIAGLTLYRDAAGQRRVQVSIDVPASGHTVEGYRLRIAGTVHPADAEVAVLVRSEIDDHWWVQPVVRADRTGDGPGRWSVNGYVGTARDGRGENFQLVALASADGRLFNLFTGRYLRRGYRLGTIPPWPMSDPVVIHRAE